MLNLIFILSNILCINIEKYIREKYYIHSCKNNLYPYLYIFLNEVLN